jgi:hypothetical protein
LADERQDSSDAWHRANVTWQHQRQVWQRPDGYRKIEQVFALDLRTAADWRVSAQFPSAARPSAPVRFFESRCAEYGSVRRPPFCSNWLRTSGKAQDGHWWRMR